MITPHVVAAPAKINLFLDILRRRDDGFHDLHTIFHRVDLADELHLEAESESARPKDVPLITSFRIDLEEGIAPLPVDEGNIAWKALAALEIKSERRFPALHVTLRKRIPHGGGLGGGSSDAAAALEAANAVLHLGLSELDLVDVATGLGSDCPFFLMPPGAAYATGRGEVLASVPAARFPLLLVHPGFAIPTKEAYGLLSPEELGERSDAEGTEAWLARGGSGPLPRMENTFEAVLEPDYPTLAEIREELARLGALHARLSGSGSVVFGLFQGDEERDTAGAELGGRFRCYPCRLAE